MYAVVACPRCRRARVTEPGRTTVACAGCGRDLELDGLRTHFLGPDLTEAQDAAGLLNARLAHREDEYLAAMLPQEAPRAPRHDDAYHAAAAATRLATSEKDRVDRLARALAAALGDFCQSDLAKAFHVAGLPASKLDDHLERMLVTSVLFEPRPGRFKAF